MTGDGERGSATVWAATAAGLLLVVGLVGVDLASAVRTRHQAGSAADLAALAAAGRSVDGAASACDAAHTVAERNGAALRTCRLDGWDAVVEIEVGRRWTLLGHGPAVAAARAGPAPMDPTVADSAAPPEPARPTSRVTPRPDVSSSGRRGRPRAVVPNPGPMPR